ncbi:MAG: ester cyclase [Nitriliruptoraceae bacterium]
MSQDHISIFESSTCEFTEQEQRNLEVIRGYRAATVSERAPFMHPDFERIRAGFKNIGELWGGGGMTDESIPDRENILLELTAKGDRVWGIWRVVGTHGGELYGIPATNRKVDAIEVGLWRLEDGLIREAWYFGDDLGLIRQLGVEIPSE